MPLPPREPVDDSLESGSDIPASDPSQTTVRCRSPEVERNESDAYRLERRSDDRELCPRGVGGREEHEGADRDETDPWLSRGPSSAAIS